MGWNERVVQALEALAAREIGASTRLAELTAGAAWSHVTVIVAGTYRYARVRVKNADAHVDFKAGAGDPAQDGDSLPVNGWYLLGIPPDATHMHIKRDDAATDAKVKVTLIGV